jgi:phage tail-like protein
MPGDQRPIRFRDYLPEVFRGDEVDGPSLLDTFLAAFEALFEELEGEIEGPPGAASGGIPDLFSPATTPPPELAHRPGTTAEFLQYLAGWIALPLRADRSDTFNRALFEAALPLVARRGTLPGLEALLRVWLDGELLETDPPLRILTDLGRAFNDVDAVFRLDENATLEIDTVLGEGAPFFFVVDLITDPMLPALRGPAGLRDPVRVGLDGFQRAARTLLDLEKPAHAHYELRVRAHTMQLAEAGQTTIDGRPAAQLDVTSLLWDGAWVHES